MDCDRVRDQIADYALGALDPDEQAGVERHLVGCPDCRRLAEEVTAVTTMLPLGLAAASPLRLPPALKDRLLQSLDEVPAAAEGPQAHDEPAAPARLPAANRWRRAALWSARDQATPARGYPAPGGRRLSPVHLRTLGALAAVVLLLLSLAWTARLSVALAQERALRAEFAQLVSQQQEVVLEVVDGRNTVKVLLRPPAGSDSTSYGKLYTRPDLPHVVVMAGRLPQAPAGQAYHLWLSQHGRTELAGIMSVNDQGFGLLVFDADRNGPVYDAAQLTVQPEGGAVPAGPPALLWEAPR